MVYGGAGVGVLDNRGNPKYPPVLGTDIRYPASKSRGRGKKPPKPTTKVTAPRPRRRGPGGLSFARPDLGLPAPYSGAGEDPFDSILADILAQIQGGGAPFNFDYDAARAAIEASLAPAYKRQSDAINLLKQETGERIGRQTTDVKGMFDALSQSYQSQVPLAAARQAEAQKGTADIYAKARAGQQAAYADVQADQKALFDQLNIEAAAPEASKGFQEDQAFFQSQGLSNEALAQQYNQSTGQANQNYFSAQVPIAKLEGGVRVNDLYTQLNNYMRQQDTELANIEYDRMQKITDLLGSAETGAREQWGESQGDTIDQLIKIAELQQKSGGAGGLPPSRKGREAAGRIVIEATGGDPRATAMINGVVDEILQNSDVSRGKVVIGQKPTNQRDAEGKVIMQDVHGDLTPEAAAAIARQYAKREGFPSEWINVIANAILAQFGGF